MMNLKRALIKLTVCHTQTLAVADKIRSRLLLAVFSLNNLVDCVAQLAERRSLAAELTLSCGRPAADG